MLVALVLYTINKSKKEYYLIEHVSGFVLIGYHVETVRVLEHVEHVDDVVLLVAEFAHVELRHIAAAQMMGLARVLLELQKLVELFVPEGGLPGFYHTVVVADEERADGVKL